MTRQQESPLRFATRPDGTLDGQLMLVSRDGSRACSAAHVAPSLFALLQDWDACQAGLGSLARDLESGEPGEWIAFQPQAYAAPLPRCPQWLDASAFLSHQRLMSRAFNTPPIPNFETVPAIYQGASDDFLGPCVEVPLPDEAFDIDFEGEFGAVVDHVPMGVTALEALDHIRLLVQINDWSLRKLGAQEVKTGFGFIQGKPSTSFAPCAVTPDELGQGWVQGRLHMNLHVDWNGNRFGHADGREMHFHFGELIAHAARTRKLTAGTIVGSGTVSNEGGKAGSSCIAERRTIEIIEHGRPQSSYLKFGDRIRMEAYGYDGLPGPFGAIDQLVVRATS